MRRRPSISNAHPQYRIIKYSEFTEHRIENWYLARDGSGRIIRHDSWTILDAILVAIIALLWSKVDLCSLGVKNISINDLHNYSILVPRLGVCCLLLLYYLPFLNQGQSCGVSTLQHTFITCI